VAQSLVEIIEDSWLASHDRAPAMAPHTVGGKP